MGIIPNYLTQGNDPIVSFVVGDDYYWVFVILGFAVKGFQFRGISVVIVLAAHAA